MFGRAARKGGSDLISVKFVGPQNDFCGAVRDAGKSTGRFAFGAGRGGQNSGPYIIGVNPDDLTGGMASLY